MCWCPISTARLRIFSYLGKDDLLNIGRLSPRLVPDELWALVEPLLPQFEARPQGVGTAPLPCPHGVHRDRVRAEQRVDRSTSPTSTADALLSAEDDGEQQRVNP